MTRYEEVIEKVRKTWDNNCWSFPAHNGGGYAVLKHKGKTIKACILAYEYRYGKVPSHKELDHLCTNKGCWNPRHMEPVTRSENVLRGVNPGGNALKTHCPQGHPYGDENTAYRGNKRYCLPCRREQGRKGYHNNDGREKQNAYRQRLKEGQI